MILKLHVVVINKEKESLPPLRFLYMAIDWIVFFSPKHILNFSTSLHLHSSLPTALIQMPHLTRQCECGESKLVSCGCSLYLLSIQQEWSLWNINLVMWLPWKTSSLCSLFSWKAMTPPPSRDLQPYLIHAPPSQNTCPGMVFTFNASDGALM